jgi:Ca-activated chloride channel family protein
MTFMTFSSPWMLVALAAVPALIVGYRRMLRGQAQRRADLAALGLVTPTPTRPERARHVVPVLFVAAFTLMLLALARPVASVAEPRREGTVILAFDVSTSMAAKDTKNTASTRLEDAKAAARGFVDKQPSSIRMGVVAFGGSGLVVQQPTTDKNEVLSAINRLAPQGDTAIGRGILTSLGAIAGKAIAAPTDTEGGNPDETPIGYYGGTAIVMLTDGENTVEPDPLELADLVSAAGVRIYPIGLGSTSGTVLEVEGFSIATALDEDTLKQIARTTGGTYYSAADTGALAQVYDSIELTWTSRTVPHEVTSLVAALATLLLLVGAGLSVLRSGRVI